MKITQNHLALPIFKDKTSLNFISMYLLYIFLLLSYKIIQFLNKNHRNDKNDDKSIVYKNKKNHTYKIEKIFIVFL